jgi:acetyltransferase-like isoleucine patch superfamily enzyme
MNNQLKQAFNRLSERHPFLARQIRIFWCWFMRSVNHRTVGRDNVFRYHTSLLTDVTFEVFGSGNRIEIEESVLNKVRFVIRGDNHRIKIGRGCKFNNGGTIWFEDQNGRLSIGANSTFEAVDIALTEPGSSVEIGQDCMFAYDIDVRTGDSHSILDALTSRRLNPAQNIRIGDRVWVAPHAVILKGVSLAADSVVASGAIVTRSIAETGVILAGNPARIVKRNIRWCRERIYQDINQNELTDAGKLFVPQVQ